MKILAVRRVLSCIKFLAPKQFERVMVWATFFLQPNRPRSKQVVLSSIADRSPSLSRGLFALMGMRVKKMVVVKLSGHGNRFFAEGSV